MKKRILLIFITLLVVGIVGLTAFYFGMGDASDAELAYYRGMYERCAVIAGNMGFSRIDAIGICRASTLEAISFDVFRDSSNFLNWDDGVWTGLKE